MLKPLTTQIVGSYTKPDWLYRRDRAFRLDGSNWRVGPDYLDMARRDAARLAIDEQERAGLDLITDGECQRPAYDNHFYARLIGVDTQTLGEETLAMETGPAIVDDDRKQELAQRRGLVPRIVDEIAWPGPLSIDEIRLARQRTSKPLKTTVIGPLTSYCKMSDHFYRDPQAGALAIAAALNQELRAIDREGVELIQIDEPRFHGQLALAKRFGLEAIERVTRDVQTAIAVHICYGYAYFRSTKTPGAVYAEALELIASSERVSAISLEYEQPGHEPGILRHCGDKHVIIGLLNLGTTTVETPEHVAARLRAALEIVPPERLHPSSDCGMWHLPREIAFAKIRSLVLGTRIVRHELGLPNTAQG